MTRITFTDSTMDMVMKMSGGNPGALTVCVQLLKETQRIDPDNALGGLGNILSLDTYKIYEDKIWMFYKDICDCDMTTMIGLMRASQLGYMSSSVITSALNAQRASLDQTFISDMLTKVREHLPAFAKD